MIIDWLTIDGVDYTNVEVAVYELVPTEVFGQDADEQHTTATHVGFATGQAVLDYLAAYRSRPIRKDGRRK